MLRGFLSSIHLITSGGGGQREKNLMWENARTAHNYFSKVFSLIIKIK